jgi:hypothetical protein
MRHLLVLAIVLGVAGWASAVGSAQVQACAPNTGVTVTSPLTNDHGVATVGFTVAQGCDAVQLSLVSYTAPSGTFDEQTASQQTVYRSVTQSFAAGSHTLTVDVPSCYHQIDLVYGSPIAQLGPAGTNNFYNKQGRLIANVNGGSSACVAPPTCPQSPATLAPGGITIAGGMATVTFTVAEGCSNVELSLVSYSAPSGTFNEQTASQQVLYRSDTNTFDAGVHTLTVAVPSCYYQVDFVYGAPIQQLGPAGTNNFYGKQGRLIQALNGGSACQESTGGESQPPVAICHATGSGYEQVSLDAQGVLSGHLSQHEADIIPPFTVNGVTYSQHWDTAGQAIYTNGCHSVQTTTVPPGNTTQQPVVQTTQPPAAPVPVPSITLAKLERVGTSGSFTTGPVTAKVGDTVYYQLVVTNTGTTDVSVNLQDSGCSSLTPTGPHAIVAGASLTYTCSHLITAADGASYTNTATAVANNAGPVQASVQSSVVANLGTTTVSSGTTGSGVLGATKTVKKQHKVVKKAKKVKKVTHKAKAAHAVVKAAGVTG